MAKLLAQIAYVGINAAVIRSEIATEHRLHQFLARYYVTGGAHESFQKIELD
jgi:hypothetical protein